MRDLPNVELRHLRTFVTVAETENFTRAAERLGITQPSVSVQVKELEVALGAQLFSRLGPRVALTPSGRTFRERAALVLSKLSDACQAVQESEGLVAGHVSLAVIPPLNVPWMPRVLGRIAREHPGLALTLVEQSADTLEGAVENGRCDFGVGILSRSSPNLAYELLRKDELMLLTPPDGPYARRRDVRPEDFSDLRLVVLPESYVLRQLTNEAFRAVRVLPKVALEVDTIDALLATVVESGLCTVLPSVVLEGREDLGLRAVRLEGLGRTLEFGIVQPANGSESAAVRLFCELLREVAAVKRRAR